MDHAVDAADVDEGTVAGEGLDDAVVLLADLDLVPDVLDALTALSLGNAADGADNALAGLVDLGDLETDSLLEKLAQLSLTGQIGLGGGDEHTHALDVDNNAALVFFGDNTLENGTALDGVLDIGPHLGGIQALLGQHRGSFHVVDADDNSLDGIADLDSVFDLDAVVGELGRGDEAGILGTKVNADLSAGNRDHKAGHLISIIYSFQRILQHFVKRHLFFSCGFFNFDLVTHFVSYLLNYPRWGRGAGGEAHCVCGLKPVQVELTGALDKLNIGAVLRTDLCKMHAVGTVLSADDDHCVTLRSNSRCFFLPRGRSKTYCIRYF